MLVINNHLRLDPTHTLTLRRTMAADLRSRFRELAVGDITAPSTIQSKVAGFSGNYWQQYTERAFVQGLERSWTEARKALLVPREERDITQKEFTRTMQATVREQSRELANRVTSELQQVSQLTATRLARIRSDARLARTDPEDLVKQLQAEYLKGARAAAKVAHTELIRAHAQGQLATLEQLGYSHVTVMAEIQFSGQGTTEKGNLSPCPECEQYEGVPLTIEEAFGLIPIHPYCYCSFKTLKDIEEYEEEYTENVYCPTGPGGGIDPTCSPGGGKYPKAGSVVDGREVMGEVPNLSSMDSSLSDYEVLPGLREIRMDSFTGLSGKSYSVSETERIEELANKIKHSNTISPLIVVEDKEGLYILEGGHRAEALYLLGAKSFPAVVVKDLEGRDE